MATSVADGMLFFVPCANAQTSQAAPAEGIRRRATGSHPDRTTDDKCDVHRQRQGNIDARYVHARPSRPLDQQSDTGNELKTPCASWVFQPHIQRLCVGSFMRAGDSRFPLSPMARASPSEPAAQVITTKVPNGDPCSPTARTSIRMLASILVSFKSVQC